MDRLLRRFYLPAIVLLALMSLGCASQLPQWQELSTAPGARQPEAVELLSAAVQAHGGDAFGELTDVSVQYQGDWGRLVPKLQPVLSDVDFRRRSEELYWPQIGRVTQLHDGPGGAKTVVRLPDEVEVTYSPVGSGSAIRDGSEEEHLASALVADAYTLFLFGPSFVEHRAESLALLEPAEMDGQTYPRILARLRPGFGMSAEDRVALWFDPNTSRLFRVHFTIDGLESTQGAEVDVTFDGYREVGGYWWPTRFHERVLAPIRAFAHRWETVDLRVNSGVQPDQVDIAAALSRPVSDSPLDSEPEQTTSP